MNKTYRIEIKPINNGFIVEKSWKVMLNEKDAFSYEYRNEEYMLATWADVVEWLKNNELEVAPKAS